MGCSISKEVESPSKSSKETWGAVLPKGLAVQVDRSLKTTDGGYIAAVFSANYGTLRKPGPLLLSQKPPGKGNYPQHKVSKAVRANPQILGKTLSADTTLGLSKLSTNDAKEIAAGQKSTEGTKAKLETINTWELMEGLDEIEDSSNLEPSHANHKPSLLLPLEVDREGSPTVLSNKSVNDTTISIASSGKKVATRPRPKSFTSIRSIKDVDAALAARNSKTPPPVWKKSSFKAWQADEEAREISEGSLLCGQKVSSKTQQIGMVYRDGSLPTRIPTCETTSNAEDTPISTPDDRSWIPDNLQRALSFKYIFNDNSSEKQDSPNPAVNSAASQLSEANARDYNSDGLVFASARLLSEGEGNSALSSPDSSAAASLKDWLPSDNHPLKLTDDFKGGFEPCILEAFQGTQLRPGQQTTPHLLPNSKTVRSKYVGGGSDKLLDNALKKGLECQEEADKLSIKIENCEAPVFDPELLDSFEKAMKQLSKEEWNAVRSMEDSPQTFLHLVNSLKRSSSNSVRNPKAITMTSAGLFAIARNGDGNCMNGNANHVSVAANANNIVETGHGGPPILFAKPDDGKLKKFFQEKKLPIRRQNSWELKKSTAKARRDDGERVILVFYSTTSQTDTKLYEDCNQVRGILMSLVGVSYDERSISEHLEHEQELKHALDVSSAVVPTIYVKGKYVVGVDSIVQLYKKGMLGSMLKEALSIGSKNKVPCICRGGKFLICPLCKGRRKLNRLGEGALSCRHCSGTGLINCLNCSST